MLKTGTGTIPEPRLWLKISKMSEPTRFRRVTETCRWRTGQDRVYGKKSLRIVRIIHNNIREKNEIHQLRRYLATNNNLENLDLYEQYSKM